MSGVTPIGTLPLAESFRTAQNGRPSSVSLWAARRFWRLASLLRWLKLGTKILCFELRSSVPRMKIACDAIDAGADLGPLFEESTAHAGLVHCSRTETRSRDAEFLLLTKFPWATDADLAIFFLGWERGEAFASCSCDKTKTAAAPAYSMEEC